MSPKERAILLAFEQVLGPPTKRMDPEKAAEYLRKVTTRREPDKVTTEVR